VSPVTGRLPGLGAGLGGGARIASPPLFRNPRVSEHSVFVHDSLHTKVQAGNHGFLPTQRNFIQKDTSVK